MKLYFPYRALAAIALPVCALLAWVANIEKDIANGRQIRVRVEGYDPRDLLAGHYIRFRISTAGLQSDSGYVYAKDACLCFEEKEGEKFASPISVSACHEKPVSCEIFLRGTYSGSQFTAGIERYSISEKYAPVLQIAPPDSSILLSVTEQGTAIVKKYFVGDETLEQYAEKALLTRGVAQ